VEPLFINVGALEPARVQAEGGFFGQVLRLVVRRRVRLSDFRGLLHQVVQRLEEMPEADQVRWHEFLSYLDALVYHERELSEHAGLRQSISNALRTDEHRREVDQMRKTMADVLKEEGGVETARSMLLDMLRERFGEVPPDTAAVIETATDLAQLKTWSRRFAKAKTLKEVGITAAS
jgi:hypothetical protein